MLRRVAFGGCSDRETLPSNNQRSGGQMSSQRYRVHGMMQSYFTRKMTPQLNRPFPPAGA
jgi:hypothetical protein